MPIRINPLLDLGPCVLTLENIKKIADTVEKEFPQAVFSADDKIWQIYGEPKVPFLTAVAHRDLLDAFGIWGQVDLVGKSREITVLFNDEEASIKLVADPEDEIWFEHLVTDIKKHLGPPTFRQMVVYRSGSTHFDVRLLFLTFPVDLSAALTTPYCRITIKQNPPNPFVENVKANLVSNVLWAIFVFILGIVSTLVGQLLLGK